ncbi:uncharacterized protein LOC125940790 [Dermacentor silvarum]|uniref:uncharacterized protein LOC125940790 n=1 Tax=Dermacentor silvarum TaxID=543639 RepID=UPI002100A1F9|nr:uncharacterized protein LOC125940790 [Dermacentor silvarum]
METASSRLRDLERAIPSLDTARLSTRFQKLLNRLKARGVDLQKSCSSVVGSTKCWMTGKLPALNEVLWAVHMQVIVEHVPGEFTLDCVRDARIDEESTASSFLEPSCWIYWILRHHACIRRVVLDYHAVFLRYFPTTLSKALLANKGLIEIQAHSAGSCMPKTTGCAALTRVLCQMSSRLECVNVMLLVLDHAAGDSLADGQP